MTDPIFARKARELHEELGGKGVVVVFINNHHIPTVVGSDDVQEYAVGVLRHLVSGCDQCREWEASFDNYDRAIRRAQEEFFALHPETPERYWPDAAKSLMAYMESVDALLVHASEALVGKKDPVGALNRINAFLTRQMGGPS